MKITAHEEYGLRLILRLAKLQANSDQLVSLSEIAQEEGISSENTALILGKLKEAGLVESIRGKYGGYKLQRRPDEINLFQIINGISRETFDIDFCETHAGKSKVCVHSSDCSVRSVWSSVSSMVNNFLASISLESLMKNENDFSVELKQSLKLEEILQNG